LLFVTLSRPRKFKFVILAAILEVLGESTDIMFLRDAFSGCSLPFLAGLYI
jgi:hypothetical protein